MRLAVKKLTTMILKHLKIFQDQNILQLITVPRTTTLVKRTEKILLMCFILIPKTPNPVNNNAKCFPLATFGLNSMSPTILNPITNVSSSKTVTFTSLATNAKLDRKISDFTNTILTKIKLKTQCV